MSIENDPRLANSTTGIYLQKTFNIEPRTPRCFPGVNKPKTYSERLRMGLDCDEVYPGIIIGKQINIYYNIYCVNIQTFVKLTQYVTKYAEITKRNFKDF